MLRGAFLATVALLSPCRTQVCAHAPGSSDHLAVITECVENAQGGVETLLGSISGYRSASTGAWTLADTCLRDSSAPSRTMRRERSHSTHVAQILHPSSIRTETARITTRAQKGLRVLVEWSARESNRICGDSNRGAINRFRGYDLGVLRTALEEREEFGDLAADISNNGASQTV